MKRYTIEELLAISREAEERKKTVEEMMEKASQITINSSGAFADFDQVVVGSGVEPKAPLTKKRGFQLLLAAGDIEAAKALWSEVSPGFRNGLLEAANRTCGTSTPGPPPMLHQDGFHAPTLRVMFDGAFLVVSGKLCVYIPYALFPEQEEMVADLAACLDASETKVDLIVSKQSRAWRTPIGHIYLLRDGDDNIPGTKPPKVKYGRLLSPELGMAGLLAPDQSTGGWLREVRPRYPLHFFFYRKGGMEKPKHNQY